MVYKIARFLLVKEDFFAADFGDSSVDGVCMIRELWTLIL